jgi:carbamoylphosphate synthase small subunit
MARVSTSGLMEEFTRENGSTIKWKDKESSLGATAEDTWALIKTIKKMGSEHSSGLMVESTSVNGAKESNTAKESTLKKESVAMVSGKWERESSGSKTERQTNENLNFDLLA